VQRSKLKRPVSPLNSCATVLLLWRLSGAMGTFTAVWLCQLSSSKEGGLSSSVQTGERDIHMTMLHIILPAAALGPCIKAWGIIHDFESRLPCLPPLTQHGMNGRRLACCAVQMQTSQAAVPCCFLQRSRRC
jgi:hypothetical protein